MNFDEKRVSENRIEIPLCRDEFVVSEKVNHPKDEKLIKQNRKDI